MGRCDGTIVRGDMEDESPDSNDETRQLALRS
jgi:hypothetical protein